VVVNDPRHGASIERLRHSVQGGDDLIPHSGGVMISAPKTAKGRRSIALEPASIEALKAPAARQLDDEKEWGEAAMLPEIRLHDLRHTHATLALRAGIHPKVVSERLGHATIAITLDTCSHAIPAMLEEAAGLITHLVSAAE
jgi:integrase